MQIRAMAAADIAAIVILEEKIFACPWSEQAFIEELGNQLAHYYLLIVEDEIVAYLGYWQILDEAHITNIAVAPEQRRKGYASYLLTSVLEMMKKENLQSITLEVRASNVAAQNLYSQFGFQFAGKRKGYYADNKEDAYIMWLHYNQQKG